MKFVLTVGLSFVAGVYVAMDNPMLGRNIKSWAELSWMYISNFIGA